MKNYELKKALKIGSLGIGVYLLSYYMRNILSIVTPEILENQDFTKEFIAILSSSYMIAYALGQLLNGFIGDVVKPKYMMLVGLSIVGISLVCFPNANFSAAHICFFITLGFGFSMLRGPIVKFVSENTLPQYARICCMMISVSYYVGPLIAGLFALFFSWQMVFAISGIFAMILAISSFWGLSVFEKSGLIVPMSEKKEKTKHKMSGVLSVFRLDNFIIYIIIGMILEVSGTAIAFWMPTYVNEYLGFSAKVSGLVFSAVSLMNAFGPFLCLLLFKKFGENDMRMIRIMLGLSALFFVGMGIIHNIWINLFLLLGARLANGVASGVMWSIYIPSLAKSGRVSSANGILDCAGYVGAAIATSVFAVTIENIGWIGTILLWGALATMGALVTIFGQRTNKQ